MRTVVPLSSLAVCLSSGMALAQPAPAPAPAPAAPAPAPAPVATPAPAAELPKSKVQTVLEEKLRAMRSGQGLTGDEAARRAAESSAQVAAKRATIESTEASISQTKYAFWPKLKLTASYTRLAPLDMDQFDLASFGPLGATFVRDLPNVWNFAADLSVPLSDYLLRLSGAMRGSKRSREAARADELATQAAVARDTRVAYYQWVRAQAREIIAMSSLEQARAHLQDATNAFQAGLVSKADVLQAEAAVKNAQLFGEQTKNAAALGALGLRVAMHDATNATYQVGEDIFADTPELSQLPAADVAYREALATRAELRSLGALSDALRAQADTERAAAWPRVDAFGNVSVSSPNQRYFPPSDTFIPDWRVGVALTWTPTDIGVARGAAGVAEARAKELDAQARALRDGLRLEVEQALKAAEEARFAIGVTHHGAAAAEESYRVRRELFRAGRATLSEVTDSESLLTNARLQMADAHVAARIALAQLRHALGRDQRDPKAQKAGIAP